MKTVAGIWIDHRKAIIVTLSDKGQETKEIPSNVEKQLGRSEGKHSTAPFESQLVKSDDKQQRGFTKKLKNFYEEALVQIKDAESVAYIRPRRGQRRAAKAYGTQRCSWQDRRG